MKSLGSRHQPHGLFFSLSRLLIRCSHVKITHDYFHVWHFYSSLSLLFPPQPQHFCKSRAWLGASKAVVRFASKLRDSSMDELIPGCAYSERIYRSLSLFLNSCPRSGVESGRGRSLPQADIISLLGDGVGDMVNAPWSRLVLSLFSILSFTDPSSLKLAIFTQQL